MNLQITYSGYYQLLYRLQGLKQLAEIIPHISLIMIAFRHFLVCIMISFPGF
jgi:hypothetical protein